MGFSDLPIDDGLPQNTVDAIAQDTVGMVWLDTEEVLDRFDGYDRTTFVHAAGNPEILADNQARCFAPATGSSADWPGIEARPYAGAWVRAVELGHSDDAWVGTSGGGVTGWYAERGFDPPSHDSPSRWKTWWAYSFYLPLVLAAFLVYAHQQRARILLKDEYSRQLEEQVQLRTQDLAERALDLEAANRKLETASVTDALTGLRNRHFLLTHLKNELREAIVHYPHASTSLESTGAEGANSRTHHVQDYLVIMVDLDGFKPLNDTYGHAAGDAALVQVGALLTDVCRDTDTVVRWGGDEFLILCRRVERDEVAKLAGRVLDKVLGHKFDVGDGNNARLGCSVGCALFPFFPEQPMALGFEDTMKLADRALYFAKQQGRARWAQLQPTETTPQLGLVPLVNDDLEGAVAQDQVDIVASTSPVQPPMIDALRIPLLRSWSSIERAQSS